MVVIDTEPYGGRVDGLSDSHNPAEGTARRERVPGGEGLRASTSSTLPRDG